MPTHDHSSRSRDDSPSRGLAFSIEQMRSVDAFAIDQLGIPGILLMEHAALALRDRVLQVCGSTVPVVVLVGPGNNGGDGHALARLLHLHNPKRAIRCVLLGGTELQGDAGTNLRMLGGLLNDNTSPLEINEGLPSDSSGTGLIVDAMFGSGLSRPLQGRYAEAVGWTASCREAGWKVLAVDVPSGLNANTGQPVEPDDGERSSAISADFTLTLGGMKIGLLHSHCHEWTGAVEVGDIGVPRWLLERFGQPIQDEGRAQG